MNGTIVLREGLGRRSIGPVRARNIVRHDYGVEAEIWTNDHWRLRVYSWPGVIEIRYDDDVETEAAA